MDRPPTLAWYLRGETPQEGTSRAARKATDMAKVIRTVGDGIITAVLLGATREFDYQPTEKDVSAPKLTSIFGNRKLTEIVLTPEDPGNTPDLTFARLLKIRNNLRYLYESAVVGTIQGISDGLHVPRGQVERYAGNLIIPTQHAMNPDIVAALHSRQNT